MKQALIISGGGSKGAFAAGVIKDMFNIYQLDFEILVGTSTGALLVPLAAMGELEAMEKLYTSVTDEQILEKYNIGERLGTTSIFSAVPLTRQIDNLYTDDFFARLLASGKELYLATVCLQTEELVVFTTATNPVSHSYYTIRKIVNGDQFRRAVLASASQPVFMPPVKVNKNVPGEEHPDYQFVDGGLREYAGIGIASDAGAQELFTIVHSSRNPTVNNREFKNLFGVLEQTIAVFITDVSANDLLTPSLYNQGLMYIQKVKDKLRTMGWSDSAIEEVFTVDTPAGIYQHKQPLKIHLIQPDTDLGGGPGGLVFNPAEMKQMLLKGQLALQSYVANLQPGDTDWA